MSPEILAIVMFLTTLLFLLFGFPVAFTLAGSSLIFAFLGDLLGVFNFKMLLFFPQRGSSCGTFVYLYGSHARKN